MKARSRAVPRSTPSTLDDLRVLEVTGIPGQFTGKLLADLGADVVKVEPIAGARSRRVGPFYHDEPHRNRSLYFWHYNTSKRGITLDLDNPDGQEIFKQLVAEADVVLESEAPGTMTGRGLGYEALRKINKRLIYCSVTPYGQTGPWAHLKATDLTLMASGGQMGVCGYDPVDDPSDTPIAPGGGNAWHIGDHNACIAILIALYHRDLRGVGDYIDVSAHDAIALCTENAFPNYVLTSRDNVRQTGRHSSLTRGAPVQYLCKDGRYANCFFARMKPEEFVRLRDWLDEYSLAGELMDDKYIDPEELAKAMPMVMDAVKRLCLHLTADEVFHGGQKRKFAWTVVRAPSELLGDAQYDARGFWIDIDHPELGETVTYPGAPYLMSESPWRIRKRAPLLGEDNVEVLHKELGIPLDRLTALAEMRVI